MDIYPDGSRSARAVREWVQQEESRSEGKVVTRGQRGMVVGTFQAIYGGPIPRYVAWGWLFQVPEYKARSGTLSDAMITALWNWMNPAKIDGEWVFAPHFQVEAIRVLTAAVAEQDPLIAELMNMGAVINSKKSKWLTDLWNTLNDEEESTF